ncbi:Replication-associated recombination protein A [Rosistilla oblonga]|uniref:replication-associated recombination protein A n=1 Tax=Rosistilla oblonga TaxID=2527990 RepID=UPI00118BCDB1|nr:replication-associated recombination protein A [Rosistilla oblonga]QDV14162.1 Replication-associated recombination protein A [Rosistilla oblonga]
MSLFDEAEADHLEANKPLAARMRPRQLTEFAGQEQLLGEGKLLRRMIDARQLGSILFFGPPGTGKTTLAELLAHETGGRFHSLSAVLSGVKELREVLAQARDDVSAGAPRPILFIDEIHRFNKSQQDALLPDVEAGIVTLVGATTSNPYFAINAALISRSQVFQFEPLSNAEIVDLLQRAIRTPQRGLGDIPIEADDEALQYIATMVEGDARKALGALEIGVLSSSDRPVRFDLKLASESLQQKSIRYDGTGDEHYDMASALIKSLRGSDPDASLYWLARMLEGGEDVRFLCRRLVILASEDVGNADPQALPLAVAAMQACEFIGLPECQLTLSQTVIYLALAPKSNSATTAIGNARTEVRQGDLVPVPVALRDKHYQGAKDLGHGEGYLYAHNHADGVAAMDYLGIDREFYEPSGRGFEQELAERLVKIREKLKQAK